MPQPGGQQDPEVIRQWMSQNLMSVSGTANGGSQPYPQIDPRLLAGSGYAPQPGYGQQGQQYQGYQGHQGHQGKRR